MSRIKLDLSQFKHIKSDKNMTTLQHRDGHILTMAHNSLSPAAQQQLKSLASNAQTPLQADEKKHQDMKLAEGGEAKDPTRDAQGNAKPGYQQAAQGAKDRDTGRAQTEQMQTATSPSTMWENIKGAWAEGGKIKYNQPEVAKRGEESLKNKHKPTPEGTARNKKFWDEAEATMRPMAKRTPMAEGGRLKSEEEYKKIMNTPDNDVDRGGGEHFTNLQKSNNELPNEDVEGLVPATAGADNAVADEVNNAEDIAEREVAKKPIPQEIKQEANDLQSSLNQSDIGNVKSVVPKMEGETYKPSSQEPPQNLAQHLSYLAAHHGVPALKDAIHAAFAPTRAIVNTAKDIGTGLIAGASGEAEPTAPQAQIQQAPPKPQQPPAVIQPPAALEEPSADQIAKKQEAAGSPTLESDISDTNNPMGMATQGFANQIQAEKAKALATQGMAGQESQALQADAEAKQRAFSRFQDSTKVLNDERLAHIEDIKNGHIDPNAYWKDHSKVAAGIGMIIAGFNPAGKPNAAIDFLKHQMDQNIDAQKQNLNSKNNLLNANLQQFKNIHMATEMTRLMQNDVLTNQLQMAAAKAKTPLAQAAAQAAIGQIQMESAAKFRQFAMMNAVMGLSSKGDPQSEAEFRSMTTMMRMMGMGDQAKDMESKRIPGIGTASREVPSEVLKEITAHKAVNDLMNMSLEFSAAHRGAIDKLSPSEIAKANTIQGQLIGAIKQAQHDGVYKPSEAEFLTSQIGGSPASFVSSFSSEPKIRQLQAVKQNEFNQLLAPYGIKPPALPMNQPQQGLIQGKDGRMYKKVPGGYVPVNASGQ